MVDTVTLKVGGQVIDAWTSLRIERSIDTVCSRFQLSLANPVGAEVDLSAISDQAPCQIYLGGDLVMTGFIDHVSDKVGQSLMISGRDKTMDLVDCSAVHKPGWWRGQTLQAIVKDLVAPFGIALRVECDTGGVFANFALEHGETAFEAISRLCQMRGVMVRSDADGALVVFKPTGKRAAITFELGRNLEEFSIDIDSAGRCSTYTLKGQHHGGDFVSPKDAAQPSATSADPGVSRYRPLIIISQDQATLAGLKSRALWEATVRKGRALKVGVAVKGWRDDAGVLFRPDTTAGLVAAARGLDLDMTIASLSFTLEDKGSRTALTLSRPEAFTTEALLEPKVKKHKKHGGPNFAAEFGDN